MMKDEGGFKFTMIYTNPECIKNSALRQLRSNKMKNIIYDELKVNDKVITRDDREGRVICTDRVHPKPIVALINQNGYEETYHYNRKGEHHASGEIDIFLPPKKEYVVIYKDSEGLIHAVIRGFNTRQNAEIAVKDMEFGETTYNIIEVEL